MKRLRKIVKIIFPFFLSVLLLMSCGNKLFDKSVEQGKLAVANQEYDKAKASFELALDEKEDDEVWNMLLEVENFLAGLEAKENGKIDEAIDYFKKIVEGDQTLSPLVEEAQKLEEELEELKEQRVTYNEQLTEAEELLEKKHYEESKEFLYKVIEETKEEECFEDQHTSAQELLEKVDLAIEEVEKQKQAEEAARQKEEEEAKRKEEAQKQQAAAEEKTQATSERDRIFAIAEETFGTDALTCNEFYYNGELYYHFYTLNYPKVQGIIGPDGKLYDAYQYNSEGVLEEM